MTETRSEMMKYKGKQKRREGKEEQMKEIRTKEN
jgi:hypothetical protein